MGVFLLLGLTYYRSSQVVLEDPAAIEANLQAIATCEIPMGYRALRGADDDGHRRIAILAPLSFGGNTMEVDLKLVISAWSFPTGLSGPDAPTLRSDHAVVWTGTEMIVFGGNQQFSPNLQDGKAYDPQTDSWITPRALASETPLSVRQHTMVWVVEQMVVWGGLVGTEKSQTILR